MNYYEKYLKYKNKYLQLKNQDGGFIKGDKIEREYTKDTYKFFKEKLDEQMPLCYFDSTKTNFILINDANYILINKKVNDDYELYQLNKTYDIIKLEKPHEMIEDDIQIPGISKVLDKVYKIDLINSYVYHNENIFRNFFSEVWTTAYPHFNRLKDIMYIKTNTNQILYRNKMNIVLADIFINNLELFFTYMKYNFFPSADDKNYYVYQRTKVNNNFNEIKSGILYDYISNDDLFIEYLDVDSFDKLTINLNKILSNILSLDFTNESIINDFNIFMNILYFVYNHVENLEELTDKYNYLLFINKYKNFNDIKDKKAKDKNYKSLKSFINTYNENIIKNKYALNLSCLIYLGYKTNIELVNYCMIDYKENYFCEKSNTRVAHYMILDYFWGISKINNPCIPINKRQVLIKLLEKEDSNELRKTPITDEREANFYNFINQKFKEIKQYTFYDPIRYTDCGETTILNIFNYLLLKEDGSFDLSNSDSWDSKLKEFYLKYPTMESMTLPEIYITLKKDLSVVFNKRGYDIIYNLEKEQCDIHTTMDSMIKTCSFLLGIETDNFIDIFKKLNKNVKNEDVVTTYNSLTYSNIFTLSLNTGHGEFNLLLDKNKIYQYNFNYGHDFFNPSLNMHWISLSTESFPKEYSLEHFKFYLKKTKHFFKYFPVEKQTEEICLAAVEVNNKTFDYIDNKQLRDFYKDEASRNFSLIKNKTYKICKAGVSVNWNILKEVPKDLLNKELCLIAFNQDIPISYFSIEIIPFEFQDKKMANKLKELLTDATYLLKFINPELLYN